MKNGLGLLKLVAIVLLVVSAILFWAKSTSSAAWGLMPFALALWAASDVKL